MMHQEVIDEHSQNIQDILNSLTRDFVSYEPSFIALVQALWRFLEEGAYALFSQIKPHHSRPTTRALVELENTQNARKLDGYNCVDIDTRFLCGITHEIMTHPMYDRNHPHQKMDYRPLLTWLSENNTHPFNRSALSADDLEYDEKLKVEIDQFVTATIDAGEMSRLEHHQCFNAS